jgi:hypothetical protein
VHEAITRGATAVDDWARRGVGYCMNHYNAGPAREKPEKKPPRGGQAE